MVYDKSFCWKRQPHLARDDPSNMIVYDKSRPNSILVIQTFKCIRVLWCKKSLIFHDSCILFFIAGVGKSSLLLRFSDSYFTTNYITTLG